MEKEFIIQKAGIQHLSEIMGIIKEVQEGMIEKEWFAADDEAFIREILEGDGFVTGAWEKERKEMAGYFSVLYPDRKDNLGVYAGLSEKERQNVVYLDSAAVKKSYRGNKLQRKMLEAAEHELNRQQREQKCKVQYRMCTVHPDNQYSLKNMQQNGYQLLARTELYGGLDRYILCKTVSL